MVYVIVATEISPDSQYERIIGYSLDHGFAQIKCEELNSFQKQRVILFKKMQGIDSDLYDESYGHLSYSVEKVNDLNKYINPEYETKIEVEE